MKYRKNPIIVEEEVAELDEELELWQNEALHQTGRIQELTAQLAHARDGYVKLAEDQTLPEGVGECMDCNDSRKMLDVGWRKVIL